MRTFIFLYKLDSTGIQTWPRSTPTGPGYPTRLHHVPCPADVMFCCLQVYGPIMHFIIQETLFLSEICPHQSRKPYPGSIAISQPMPQVTVFKKKNGFIHLSQLLPFSAIVSPNYLLESGLPPSFVILEISSNYEK